MLPEIGLEGQKKLSRSKVLIIGAGGLGAPVIQYLAAAGIGNLTIIDHDTIELSNLQRQVIFKHKDIGKAKAQIAAMMAAEMNPEIKASPLLSSLNNDNAIELISKHDLIIDCTDNFQTRYLINDACVLTGKPFIYGSVFKFEGQVSVFNLHPNKNNNLTYRHLYPSPPPPELAPSCAENGVMGTLPGIIGSIQANEAIKILSGTGKSLYGTLFILDSINMNCRNINLNGLKSDFSVEKLENYDYFCGSLNLNQDMKEVNVTDLKNSIDKGEGVFLIDVREKWEFDMANIGGINIPLSMVPEQVDKFPKDKKVIVYCRSGKRSANAILWLEENHQFTNLFNLEGGILDWSDKIDSSIPKY